MGVPTAVSYFFGTGTILALIAAVVLLALIFSSGRGFLPLWLERNALVFAFLVALGAAAGSIYLSSVAGFPPCVLCWYQRILLFPQVALFGLALARREHGIAPYTLMLSILGALVALYHIALPWLGSAAVLCGAAGASCAVQYVQVFSFITIPVMSLAIFLLLIALSLLVQRMRKV